MMYQQPGMLPVSIANLAQTLGPTMASAQGSMAGGNLDTGNLRNIVSPSQMMLDPRDAANQAFANDQRYANAASQLNRNEAAYGQALANRGKNLTTERNMMEAAQQNMANLVGRQLDNYQMGRQNTAMLLNNAMNAGMAAF